MEIGSRPFIESHQTRPCFQEMLKCFKVLFKKPREEDEDEDEEETEEEIDTELDGYFHEAIADHVSMKMSWDALRIHLGMFPNAEQKLPTRSEHSVNRTFFMTHAYVWCHASNFFAFSWFITHPPGFHRINRGLSNLEEFQRTFECEESDTMVAKPRCLLFRS